MNKEIPINVLRYKWVIGSVVIITLLAVFISLTASLFNSTVYQTYFIIVAFTIGLGIVNMVLKKQIQRISIVFKESSMKIQEKTFLESDRLTELEIPYSEIVNYNTYTLTTKRVGRIIRIKTNKQEYLYYLNWISADANNKFKDNEFHQISNILQNKLYKIKRYTFKDTGILFLGIVSWVILTLSIITVIGCLVYFFNN